MFIIYELIAINMFIGKSATKLSQNNYGSLLAMPIKKAAEKRLFNKIMVKKLSWQSLTNHTVLISIQTINI